MTTPRKVLVSSRSAPESSKLGFSLTGTSLSLLLLPGPGWGSESWDALPPASFFWRCSRRRALWNSRSDSCACRFWASRSRPWGCPLPGLSTELLLWWEWPRCLSRSLFLARLCSCPEGSRCGRSSRPLRGWSSRSWNSNRFRKVKAVHSLWIELQSKSHLCFGLWHSEQNVPQK